MLMMLKGGLLHPHVFGKPNTLDTDGVIRRGSIGEHQRRVEIALGVFPINSNKVGAVG